MTTSTHLYYDPSRASLLKLAWHEPLPGSAVPEAVVQEIWRTQRLRPGAMLRTTGGLSVEVIDPGTLNHDGGPDFRHARLRIGETVWFGDVEIHTTSRGWIDHAHQRDALYNRVVLHVVLQPDLWTGELTRADGSSLPELVLAPHLDSHFRERLVAFFARPSPERPCAWGAPRSFDPLFRSWLGEQARTRLLRRARAFESPAEPAQVLFEQVSAALGYRPNAAPMKGLAQRVALSDLCTLRSQRDREALLLGMAGLLPADQTCDSESREYAEDLQRRFDALCPRNARPMSALEWQHTRLRPANFPALRIAQLAALVRPEGLTTQLPQMAHLLVSGGGLRALMALLKAAPGPFWTRHYRLTHASAPHPDVIGAETRRRIVVNVLIPAAIAAAPEAARERAAERAVEILEKLPPEDDRLVRGFNFASPAGLTFLHTQGLHELDESFCRPQRCLSCAIGIGLLQRSSPPPS